MIRRLSGKLESVGERFAVVDVHGVGLKVFLAARAIGSLPATGSPIAFETHLIVREDVLDLYGFQTEEELEFFERLISVSGVGPRSALSILDVASLKDLRSAIAQNRPDLLTQASGVGRKTAERIIIELRGKVSESGAEATVERMDADTDLLETLVSLGYRREEARSALERVDPKTTGLEARLKAALALLSRKR